MKHARHVPIAALAAMLTLLLASACDRSTPSSAVPSRPVAQAPVEPAAPREPLHAFVGAWRVTAVHVDTEGVQALRENDPADMGAVLDIAAGRLAWRPRGGGTFDDVCTAPRLASDGRVTCRSGSFGPPDARLASSGGRLTLDWYDGAGLVLERMR